MSDAFKNSPWSCFPNKDGSIEILFRDNGQEIANVKLDKSNRIKLALCLLETHIGLPLYLINNDYNPTNQGVSVHHKD